MEKNIDRYDNGYWSLYNLIHEHPATRSYHALHIEQLKVLFNLTNKEIFNKYAKRWEKYPNKPINRCRAILKRGMIHVKRYGIRGSVKRYFLMRKWMKK